MQDIQELAPDEETFRRVWQRVMPDESISPIVVHRPGPGQPSQRPTQRPPQRPPENRPDGPERDERLIRQMLEELENAMARMGAVVRRQPRARPIWESLNRSAARLRTLWYLITGDRWVVRPRRETFSAPVDRLLREQYLWEISFSRLCREGMEKQREEETRELMPELEQASRRRRGMIRNLLA